MSSEASDSVTGDEHRLTVAEGLLAVLSDKSANPTLALSTARELLLGKHDRRELTVEEAVAGLTEFVEEAKKSSPPFVSDEYKPTDEMGEPLGVDDEDEEKPVKKPRGKRLAAGLAAIDTNETGRSAVAAAEFTGMGFTDTTTAGLTATAVSFTPSLPLVLTEALGTAAGTGTGGTSTYSAMFPGGAAKPFPGQVGGPDVNAMTDPGPHKVTAPPNLRAAEGWERCGNCIFFHKGCNLYGVDRPPLDTVNPGVYPVGWDDVCDSHRTLTPVEVRTFDALSGAYTRMSVAEAAHDTVELVRAQARIDAANARLDETWSDAARKAAALARRAGGLHSPSEEERVRGLGSSERHIVGNDTDVMNDPEHGFSVIHHGAVVSHHGQDAGAALAHAHSLASTPSAPRQRDPALDPAYRERRRKLIAKYGGPHRTIQAAEVLSEVKSDVYPDLGKTGDKNANWVSRSGGLPRYIERIAKHLHYEKGKDISQAIAIAVNVVKRMCASGDTNFPGKQNVNAKSRGEACAAVAEWEAKKAKTHAKSAVKGAKAVSESTNPLLSLPEETWRLAEAVIEEWEPTLMFERILRAVERTYRPIPPSMNFVLKLHEEIALVEGSRDWMVGMGLFEEEIEEADVPDGHMFVKALVHNGHKVKVTRKGNKHYAHVDGKMLSKGHPGRRTAELAGKAACDAMDR